MTNTLISLCRCVTLSSLFSQAIYISKIIEGGAAEKDGKLLKGDRIVSVSNVLLVFVVVLKFDKFSARFQINGVDIDGIGHDQAVAMLTGVNRFVRLVVERETTLDVSKYPSPGPDRSHGIFGPSRYYPGLYNSGVRPGVGSEVSPLNESSKKPADKTNGVPRPAAWNGPVGAVQDQPPIPAPRRLTKSDSGESQEKTETVQVSLFN